MKNSKLFLVLCVCFLLTSSIQAEVPRLVNYQGKLTTEQGGCLDDTVSMTFTIYSDDQGAVAVWTEDQDNVIVKEGIFNVLLGSKDPIPDSIFDGNTKYLGVQVESDPEMRPLKPMVTVAYAFHSTTADSALNVPAAGIVSVDGVSNPGGDVDLIETDAITIVPDDGSNTITFGETHSDRTDNPHAVTAAQTGALVSADGVSNPGGDVDLIETDAITIVPDDGNNTITFGETHSDRTDNPHAVTAAQAGALVSADGVSNSGGDVDFIQDNSITITPNDEANTITFGESHSERTDNPHAVSASQTGALVSVDGVSNPGGDVDFIAGGNMTITPNDGANTITFSATGSGGGWTDDGTVVRLETNTDSVGIGTTSPTEKLDVVGNIHASDTVFTRKIELGSPAENGFFALHKSGNVLPVISGREHGSGAEWYLRDGDGSYTHELAADDTGPGGWFAVYGENGPSSRFLVDGNPGTGDPTVWIQGSGSTTIFTTAASGNSAVSLPGNAVASSEILDEPGVASNINGGTVYLTGGIETLISRSITAPAAGYVLIIAHGGVTADHDSLTTSSGVFGVSDDNTSFPANQEVNFKIPASAPTGIYQFPTAYNGLFSVTSGTHTFFFLGQESSGQLSIADLQFSLVYIPTAYGEVTSAGLEERTELDQEQIQMGGLSPQNIDAERVESEAFNSVRIERELAELRAEIDELRQTIQEQTPQKMEQKYPER